MTSLDIVDAFYSQYNPSFGGEDFCNKSYRHNIAAEIGYLFSKGEGDILTRQEVEAIYPLYRGCYWTSTDLNTNLRFGNALYPFLLPDILKGTASIPLEFKNVGLLEGKMIAKISPDLAKIQSSYGYNFFDDIPTSKRMKAYLNSLKPFWLRRNSYRVKSYLSNDHEIPHYLQKAHLMQYIDEDFPHISQMFNIKNIKDVEIYNIIASMALMVKTLKD